MKAALKLTSFDNHMKTKKIIVWLRQCSKIKTAQKILLGICFLRGAPEDVVVEIGEGGERGLTQQPNDKT
jgi:hypothetical protein